MKNEQIEELKRWGHEEHRKKVEAEAKARHFETNLKEAVAKFRETFKEVDRIYNEHIDKIVEKAVNDKEWQHLPSDQKRKRLNDLRPLRVSN